MRDQPIWEQLASDYLAITQGLQEADKLISLSVGQNTTRGRAALNLDQQQVYLFLVSRATPHLSHLLDSDFVVLFLAVEDGESERKVQDEEERAFAPVSSSLPQGELAQEIE